MILRAATDSSLNAPMSSPAEFQELHYMQREKAPAYSLSRRVMAWRNAGRKLLMVCTSIFNVSFLALSDFC